MHCPRRTQFCIRPQVHPGEHLSYRSVGAVRIFQEKLGRNIPTWKKGESSLHAFRKCAKFKVIMTLVIMVVATIRGIL